jgi:hypothetical protein
VRVVSDEGRETSDASLTTATATGAEQRSPRAELPRWRRVAGLVVGLGGAVIVGNVLKDTAPKDTSVSVGLADFRSEARRAERVSVSIAQGGEVIQRVEGRFGEGREVPARWERVVSLVPGRYRVRVEVVGAAGIASREEDVELRGEPVQLRPPRE